MPIDILEDHQRRQLGATIHALRTARGLSQAGLAKELGRYRALNDKLSPKTVGNIEAGRHNPTLSSLVGIAKALDVEVWQLFLPPHEAPDLTREIMLALLRCDVATQRLALEVIRQFAANQQGGGEGEERPFTMRHMTAP